VTHIPDDTSTMSAPNPANHPAVWHSLASDDCLRRLDSSVHGLASAEAARRLAEHGPNRLPPPARRSAFVRFLLQFHNLLIHVLLAAGVITALLGYWVDSGVIFGVVLINAIVGFIQEGRAEDAMNAIRQMLSPHAAVLRDGQLRELAADELVPGDVVQLAAGDKVQMHESYAAPGGASEAQRGQPPSQQLRTPTGVPL